MLVIVLAMRVRVITIPYLSKSTELFSDLALRPAEWRVAYGSHRSLENESVISQIGVETAENGTRNGPPKVGQNTSKESI